MDRFIIKFGFHNATHFGSDLPGIGQEASKMILHSDTLFSAICNVWAQVDWHLQAKNFQSFQSVLEDFRTGKPPFKISSAFPFSGEDYYLPKPMTEPTNLYRAPEQRIRDAKSVKKTSYLKLDYFKKWMTETGTEKGFAENLIDPDRNKSVFGYEDILPKTPVDRRDNHANIYHSSSYYFDEYCGLYAIVELEKKIREPFEFVLKHLAKYGLGGNRNIGQGVLIDIVIKKPPPELDELFSLKTRLGYCLLSLYFPLSTEQIEKKALSYGLVQRKGWIGSSTTNRSLKKKTCFAFSEGSMFSEIDNGKLVDVRPEAFSEHDVWQYGYALTIPARKEEGK